MRLTLAKIFNLVKKDWNLRNRVVLLQYWLRLDESVELNTLKNLFLRMIGLPLLPFAMKMHNQVDIY